jgi:HK97 family phage major capsid protein
MTVNPLDYVLTRMAELKPRYIELGAKDRLEVDADKGIDEPAEFARMTTEWDELETRRIDLEERNRRAVAAGSIDFQVMKREVDPFTVELRNVDLAQMLGHGKRAVDAMANKFPTDAAADGMTRLIARGGAVGETAARLAVTTGSDAYRQAYMGYMTGRQNYDARLLERANDEYRAMTAGTGASGGYMVPLYMDTSFSISGAGAYNPIRDVSSVKQITTLTYNGSSGGQGIAELLGENSAFADKAPTIAQSQITTYKIGAYIPASFEAFEDIDMLASDLGQWFADAKNIYEATQFATGSGSAPHGVVTDVTAQAGSRVTPATGGTFVVGDVYKVHQALGARYRYGNPANRAWMASVNIIDTIRQFGTANNYHGFTTDLTTGAPPRLLGDQLLEASTMSTSITTGQNILLYGDFSQFLIIDRVGMSTEFIPNVFDQASGRPSGTRAWLMHWRVGSGVRSVADAAAFRVLLL